MEEIHSPLETARDMRTQEERRAVGRQLRSKAPRSSHAVWASAADRPDPMKLLEEQNRARLAELVPLRYQRMAASAFTFLRGSAIVMARDLVGTPVTGIQVQLCGDAHLNNFGIYATPERNQVFDVNDFDETLPGPWEWDIKRLAASIILGGRANRFSAAVNRQAVLNCVQAYREHMWKYSEMTHIDVWYSRIDYERSLQFVHPTFRWYIHKQHEKSRRRSVFQVFPKLVVNVDGQPRFKDEPPLIAHLKDEGLARGLQGLVERYQFSVQDDRRVLLSKYHCVDVAQKVVGVGSVGTRCYVLLLLGNDNDDPLLLQIKEAQASVLEPHLGASVYPNSAQRVVSGQRLMQAASDLFLGWTSLGGRDYYLRQLRDGKLTVNIETLVPEGFSEYCRFCGWALARAHARSGDAAMISGYLGRSVVFDRALADFAEVYANQMELDYARFREVGAAWG